MAEERISKLVLTGETTGVIKGPKVRDNLLKLFNQTSIRINMHSEVDDRLLEFLEGGTGCLFADTYVGFEAVRKIAELENDNVPVVFLKDPKDNFFTAERLNTLGPRVVGVYDEMLTMDHFIEIIQLANRGFLEQEVHITKLQS